MSFDFKRFARELTSDNKRVDRLLKDPKIVLGEFGLRISDKDAAQIKAKLEKIGKARTVNILKDALNIIEPTW